MFFSLLIGLTSMPSDGFAKDKVLSPAKLKQIKKTNKSFNNCRKDALAAMKDGSISRKKFEVMLSTCQENFPGASLYVACKKEALRVASSKKLAPDEAIAQCQRYLLAASFDPTSAFPFFTEKGQLYFAGIGLNRDAGIKGLQPPNFNCEQLQAVAARPKDAVFSLFGNHPNTFVPLARKRGPALNAALGIKKPNTNAAVGIDVPGFGRVFGNPASDANSQGLVFFPTASCDFEGRLGPIFAGLSTYYLLDTNAGTAAPYFGIAYYRPEQSNLTTAQLIQQTIQGLAGSGSFKSYNKGGKYKNVTFIASRPIAEFDDEHDPKNVCRLPRESRYLAVVQGLKNKPSKPEYLIVANLKNLCDFGDKLARRLAE